MYFENYNTNQAKLATLHGEKIASKAAAKIAVEAAPIPVDDATCTLDPAAEIDDETEPVCLYPEDVLSVKFRFLVVSRDFV